MTASLLSFITSLSLKMASFISRGVLIASIFSFTSVLALGTSKTCSSPQLSCQNTTVVSDLCCFNAPGGQMLQTQFWDTSPSTGLSIPMPCLLFSPGSYLHKDQQIHGQFMVSGPITAMALMMPIAILHEHIPALAPLCSHLARPTYWLT